MYNFQSYSTFPFVAIARVLAHDKAFQLKGLPGYFSKKLISICDFSSFTDQFHGNCSGAIVFKAIILD